MQERRLTRPSNRKIKSKGSDCIYSECFDESDSLLGLVKPDIHFVFALINSTMRSRKMEHEPDKCINIEYQPNRVHLHHVLLAYPV